MSDKKYVIALDQGTTSSRAVLFDRALQVCGMEQKELHQSYPQAGYVEQDPMEIYASQYAVLQELIASRGVRPEEIAAIGIANQRETTVVWDRKTGQPVYPAIVWQCRRTSDECERLRETELARYIHENTGLLPDAYFSATKLRWILEHVSGARERAQRGELLFGTVDCWLLWKLTDGRVHATDETNASRTMLYNLRTHCWDERLLREFSVPEAMLPEVRPSGSRFGTLNLSGTEVPIAGVAGDQQAALFGQGCFEAGDVKNTYGTGCFLLLHTGQELRLSHRGLLTTAAACPEGEHGYAIEGSVFIGGAVIQWLRDEMRLIASAAESEEVALQVPDSGGVYIVPAFTGLGAPYWDMYARGTVVGLTRGTGRAHLVRAALESIAYQTKDVLDTVVGETGVRPSALRVDGGASANRFLMQFQADVLGIPIDRPRIRETTALGAACLAGLTVGFYDSREELCRLRETDCLFMPQMLPEEAAARSREWHRAVERAGGWARP